MYGSMYYLARPILHPLDIHSTGYDLKVYRLLVIPWDHCWLKIKPHMELMMLCNKNSILEKFDWCLPVRRHVSASREVSPSASKSCFLGSIGGAAPSGPTRWVLESWELVGLWGGPGGKRALEMDCNFVERKGRALSYHGHLCCVHSIFSKIRKGAKRRWANRFCCNLWSDPERAALSWRAPSCLWKQNEAAAWYEIALAQSPTATEIAFRRV